MAALRLVNNNYVANGTGRDLMVVFDSSYRGGNLGQESVLTHFPNPRAGEPKYSKSPKKGFGARVEGDTQHLNCSRGMNKLMAETKGRISLARSSAPRLNGATSQENLPNLLRSRSDPALAGLTPFCRTKGMAATMSASNFAQTFSSMIPEQESSRMLPPSAEMMARKFESPSWTTNMARNSYLGFARNPGGGFWPKS